MKKLTDIEKAIWAVGGVIGLMAGPGTEIEGQWRIVKTTTLKAQAKIERLRKVVELILPLAKGYAFIHDVGSNSKYVQVAEQTLAELEKEEK